MNMMQEGKKGKNRLQLLSQALSAAGSSINLARQLINEIEREGGAVEQPGLTGVFDGAFMTTQAGKKYSVPENYAAKTKLIFGDRLKMVEGPEGRRFKYIEKIPFVEVEATLAVKDGNFVAISETGSHKLIQSAVAFLEGAEGDKVKILLPRDKRDAPFGSLMEVVGKKRAGVERMEDRGRREGRRWEKRPEAGGRKEWKKQEAGSRQGEAKSSEAPREGGKPEAGKQEEKVEGKPAPAKRGRPAKEKKAEAATAERGPAEGGRGKKPEKKAAPKKTTTKKVAAKTAAKKTSAVAKKGETKIEPPSAEELV